MNCPNFSDCSICTVRHCHCVEESDLDFEGQKIDEFTDIEILKELETNKINQNENRN